MKPITVEWVQKAEGDFHTAQREFDARVQPNYDAVCFHCQQCVEKYLKALLQEADIPFRKTHYLPELLDLALAIDSTWERLRPELYPLTIYAVEYRYPSESADSSEASEALGRCGTLRQVIRRALGLEVADSSQNNSADG